MDTLERAYFERRERESLALAQAAQISSVASIHIEMARRYAAKLGHTLDSIPARREPR